MFINFPGIDFLCGHWLPMLFGDSAEEDPARRNKLIRKWRTVLALNILVSTINANGHPTFSWMPSTQPNEEPKQHSLLKYLVAMLVRDNEIVAAVAHLPKISTAAQSGGFQVNIMEGVKNAQPPAAFTAVANPHTVPPPRQKQTRSRKLPEQDPYFANVSPDIDCRVVNGMTHIVDSNNEETTLWASILKIR